MIANDIQSDDQIQSAGYDEPQIGLRDKADYRTLQPGLRPGSGSEGADEDDVYPYSNPSPMISKPQNVGGLSQKRFESAYGTDNEVERAAVANLSAVSIRNASHQNHDVSGSPDKTYGRPPQPHVTMRKHTNQASSILEETHEDDP